MNRIATISTVFGILLALGIAGALGCAGGGEAPWCALFSKSPQPAVENGNNNANNDGGNSQDRNPLLEVPVSGKITFIDSPKRSFRITDTRNRNLTISLEENPRMLTHNNKQINLDYLRTGFVVDLLGRFSAETTFIPAQVKVAQEPAIIVFSPNPNDQVGLPLVIQGEARVFENVFNYRLLNDDGTLLREGFDTAAAPDIGQYGPFTVSLNYPQPKTNSGKLEVYEISAKDGSEINKVTIPVVFRNVQSQTVLLFFGNKIKDPGVMDCNLTYSTPRRIGRTQTPANQALEELLKGPTPQEIEEGFFTSINTGVKIQKLSIANGVARVDFDDMFQAAVGGSCRVTAIRSQITNTLKQFSSVKSVIISINGKTEDILQP